MALGSRPNAGHWWRQEEHPVLNAHARSKVLSEAPSKPQGIGGKGGKIENNNNNNSLPSNSAPYKEAQS